MCAESSSSVSILIAAPAYKRNDLLEGLLASLDALAPTARPGVHVDIAIIDNDPDEGARPIVDAWAEKFSRPLYYHTEKQPGVTHVRNRALDLAATFDFLAFIDDDEYADPRWLDELLARQAETGAAAVFGPVVSVYPENAPDWMKAWAPHATRMKADGMRSKPGATNNCLIDMKAVARAGLRFDAAMSLTGGEDTLFFSRMLDQGLTLADASRAIVYEHVPASRSNVKWLVTRWYRTGTTDALIRGRNQARTVTRAKALLGGMGRIGVALPLALLTAAITLGQKPEAVLKWVYVAARGAGMIAFALGRDFKEYGRTTASPTETAA